MKSVNLSSDKILRFRNLESTAEILKVIVLKQRKASLKLFFTKGKKVKFN